MDLRVRPTDPARAQELGRALGVSSTLAQLLMHRGLTEPETARAYLVPQLSGLSDPSPMADRQRAALRLADAVRRGERIVVFGDYDVDGTTAAAILSGMLRQMGADVVALVAQRFAGGYGFSEEALGRVLAQGPSLVVTCDCGSSDHPRLAALREEGVDAIVVDHHLVPSEPLPALAFLNPHRPDCGFVYKGLCSAGLVLSLGAGVRAELGVQLDLREWLDLVALGTIADVAPLDGDNRRLVRAGLKRLSSEAARPGIVALREVAKIKPGTALGAGDVAFRLTPRLNAPGRLGDQQLSLDLLMAQDLDQARELAARVESLNHERKDVERRVTEEAVTQIEAVYGQHPSSGIVAAASGWHRGVVGISAARLVDRFGVPAVVVALEEPVGHGSCRAPDGFRLFDAVSACAEHLERFGGHQAASGIVVAAQALDGFRAAFARACLEVAPGAESPAPEVDIQLRPSQFEVPSASELSLLEPQGQGNSEAVFHLPEAVVERRSVVGDGHLKLRLRVGGRTLSAFGYSMAEVLGPDSRRVEAVGTLRPDTWVGGEAVELKLHSVCAID